MKSNKFNIFLCVASFVILIVYVVQTTGIDGIVSACSNLILGWMFAALMCMVVYWLLEALVLHLVTVRVHPGQKFHQTLRVSMIGQLFNCITPFASGGQPIQAYYMVKDGIPLGSAAMALLIKFIIYQLVLTIYSLIVLIFKFGQLNAQIPGFSLLAIVGFAVNSFVIFLLISVAIFKGKVKGVVAFFVRLLAKIKVVKNPEKTMEKAENELKNFYENFQFIKNNTWLVVKSCVLSAIQLTFYFAIAFMLYKAFGLPGNDVFTMISAQAFILLVSSFIPLPGAMGAAEGSFYLFFQMFFPGSLINIAMVFWRLLTFYLPIVVGSLFTFQKKRRTAEVSD